MKNQDTTGVVFVNTVVGRGALNGNVNLSFSTFNFTPNDETGQVDLDPVISSRLRMDKICATQLRDVLIELLDAMETSEVEHSPKGNGKVVEPVVDGLVPTVKSKTVKERSH